MQTLNQRLEEIEKKNEKDQKEWESQKPKAIRKEKLREHSWKACKICTKKKRLMKMQKGIKPK